MTARGMIERSVEVETSTPDEAEIYYAGLDAELAVKKDFKFSTFDEVLNYFGYFGLTGAKVEKLDSWTLMDPGALAAAGGPVFQTAVQAVPLRPRDVLASRFFAPKITDVSITPVTHGWRKVVRLKARSGSDADIKRLDSAWLLFNVFSNGADPFKEDSLNNQVMLVRGDKSPLRHPLYWLVFDRVSGGKGERIGYLNASFDARVNEVKEQAKKNGVVTDGRYYVPNACAHCHGGLLKKANPLDVEIPDYAAAKLNYLDTDHWFDRTKDDFQDLPQGTQVLMDSGPNRDAFGVIRWLNEEVRDQNNSAKGGPGSFQLRAVDKWLELHQSNENSIEMFTRGISASGKQWDLNDPIDKQLLPILSRYCFRCHSSVAYHVMDKKAVFDKAPGMIGRLKADAGDKRSMPQDRDMRSPGAAAKDRECLLKLLDVVAGNTSGQVQCPKVP